MSDKRITELPAASAITGDDLIPIVDSPNGTPVTQRATAAQFAAFVISAAGQVYQGRSPAAPDDPTRPALDYPVGGGSLLQWDIPSQLWV